MKKAFLLLLLGLGCYSYSQNYKTKIAKDICYRLKQFDVKGKTPKQIEMEYGVTVIVSAMEYSSDIKRDMDIDLVKDMDNEEKMEELGVQLSLAVAKECPKQMSLLFSNTNLVDSYGSTDNAANSVSLLSGEVVKISNKNFVVFYIKGDNGILKEYYWIGNIESDIDLPNEYQRLKGKNVFIGYRKNTIFDVKSNSYRTINEIKRLILSKNIRKRSGSFKVFTLLL